MSPFIFLKSKSINIVVATALQEFYELKLRITNVAFSFAVRSSRHDNRILVEIPVYLIYI